jgi:hypothetical protein
MVQDIVLAEEPTLKGKKKKKMFIMTGVILKIYVNIFNVVLF